MPITTATWIMTLTLAASYIMLNLIENKKSYKPERRLENDRRHFSYDRHIPERRSGTHRRWFDSKRVRNGHKVHGN